jgi:hypothetical protein
MISEFGDEGTGELSEMTPTPNDMAEEECPEDFKHQEQ